MKYIVRSARLDDLDDLYELSQLMLFINLPPDRSIIEQKIQSSILAFSKPSHRLWENYYLFVMEELGTEKIVGASMIHAQHGTEHEPHYFFSVSSENKFSKSLNTGFIHGTLNLGLDQNGPTEIGGLILHPEYRKNNLRLGKQLSFVRFLYMGMNKKHFKSEIHSELMPPFDSEGHSPLWEAIGRRFLNMDYHEADQLSRSNKEFILSLFPSDTIYMTLLPIEARNAVGKVGVDTYPVKRMLESIGFKYNNEVDPFDGGPHYRALLEDIKPVKEMFSCQVVVRDQIIKSDLNHLLLVLDSGPEFRCAYVSGNLMNNGLFMVDTQTAIAFSLTDGMQTFATFM